MYSIVITALTCGCNLDSDKDPIIVPEIEKEFNIDLWEELSPTSRELRLLVTTIKNEPCLNATIAYQNDRYGANMAISLDDIVAPSDCQSGMAPAQANINLGALSAATYNLSLGLKNTIINEGKLQVSYDKYEVTMETEEGLQFLHRELRRVPATAIWGYVAYSQPAEVNTANSIVEAIGDIAYEADYPQGYYGHFTINPNNYNLSLRYYPTQGLAKPFLFDFSGNTQNLKNHLADLRQSNPAITAIKVWNANGEEL